MDSVGPITPSAPEIGWRLPFTSTVGEGQGTAVRAEDLTGALAGNYRLVRQLGVGGLGSVWLGEHPVIGSRVAVKVLHPDVRHSVEATRRFVMEAQAVNRIHCPHVVRIFDFGFLDDGRDYAVMELLEGETLAERVARGPLGWPQARAIGAQVLEAITAAHQAKVVHRDLKPENIHLGSDPQHAEVKVLDFGIAKLWDGVTAQPGVTTLKGYCIGTPAYAAPEQLTGDQVGPPSDVYACGELLFEMLVGRPPFDGPLKPLVKAKLTGPTPGVATFVPGLSEAATRLIDSMLERFPDRRPSAQEALEALWAAPADEVATPITPPTLRAADGCDTLPGAPEGMLPEKPTDLFRNLVWGSVAEARDVPLEPEIPLRKGHRLLISCCITAGVLLLLGAGWLVLSLVPGLGPQANADLQLATHEKAPGQIKIRVIPPPPAPPEKRTMHRKPARARAAHGEKPKVDTPRRHTRRRVKLDWVDPY